MRPTLDKMLKGMEYILSNDIVPELSSPFALTQAMVLSGLLNFLGAIWEKTAQFPLVEENKDLKDVLQIATRALKAVRQDHEDETIGPLAEKIDAELVREYPAEGLYPSLHSLLEENYNLKENLVQTITTLDEISQNHQSQAIDELRKRIRAHLRKHLDWQLSLLTPPAV